MQVNGLDHVNIIAADIGRTLAFYRDVLGMEATLNASGTASTGRWIRDRQGRPIIHVQAHDPARHGPLPDPAGGAVDHVALSCSDFAGTLRRCAELGVPVRVNDRQFTGFRQVFITDPDQVMLELNFTSD